MKHYTPEEIADLRQEFEPRRSKYVRCSDGMCGASDCPSCHGENFNNGVLIDGESED